MGVENSVFLEIRELISNQGNNPLAIGGSFITISTAALGIYDYIRTQNFWKSAERAAVLLVICGFLFGLIFYFVHPPSVMPISLPPSSASLQAAASFPVNPSGDLISGTAPIAIESYSSLETPNTVVNDLRGLLPLSSPPNYKIGASAGILLDVRDAQQTLISNQDGTTEKLPSYQSTSTIDLLVSRANGGGQIFYKQFSCTKNGKKSSVEGDAQSSNEQNIIQYLAGKTQSLSCSS